MTPHTRHLPATYAILQNLQTCRFGIYKHAASAGATRSKPASGRLETPISRYVGSRKQFQLANQSFFEGVAVCFIFLASGISVAAAGRIFVAISARLAFFCGIFRLRLSRLRSDNKCRYDK
jgi:hypothetical protein